MHPLGNLPRPVLRPDLRKLDDLRGKYSGTFFVKLTQNDWTQLGRITLGCWLFLLEILTPNILECRIRMLYISWNLTTGLTRWRYINTHRDSAFLTIIFENTNFPARSIRPRIVFVRLIAARNIQTLVEKK